jgi:TorA maturation chaperone TorD
MTKAMSSNSTQRLEKIEVLKNIFTSSNDKELWRGFKELKNDLEISQDSLEADFNRYFIGPDSPIASPYASIYLDKQEVVMSQSTEKVRELYDLMGLKNPPKDTQPEDFIGLELDAYYQLLFLEKEKNINYLHDFRLYFLFEHIQKWIFDFVEKIQSNEKEPSAAINLIAQELKSCFENEIEHEGGL